MRLSQNNGGIETGSVRERDYLLLLASASGLALDIRSKRCGGNVGQHLGVILSLLNGSACADIRGQPALKLFKFVFDFAAGFLALDALGRQRLSAGAHAFEPRASDDQIYRLRDGFVDRK
jgi:hypothetical protein